MAHLVQTLRDNNVDTASIVEIIRHLVKTPGDPKVMLETLVAGKDGVLGSADDVIPLATYEKIKAALATGIADDIISSLILPGKQRPRLCCFRS